METAIDEMEDAPVETAMDKIEDAPVETAMDEMATNNTTWNETVIDEMPINDTAMIEMAVDKTGMDKTAVNKSSSGVDVLTDVSGDSAVIEVSNSGEAKGKSPASSSYIYSPAQSLTETGKKYSAITSFLNLPSKLQEKNGTTKSPWRLSKSVDK